MEIAKEKKGDQARPAQSSQEVLFHTSFLNIKNGIPELHFFKQLQCVILLVQVFVYDFLEQLFCMGAVTGLIAFHDGKGFVEKGGI